MLKVAVLAGVMATTLAAETAEVIQIVDETSLVAKYSHDNRFASMNPFFEKDSEGHAIRPASGLTDTCWQAFENFSVKLSENDKCTAHWKDTNRFADEENTHMEHVMTGGSSSHRLNLYKHHVKPVSPLTECYCSKLNQHLLRGIAMHCRDPLDDSPVIEEVKMAAEAAVPDWCKDLKV